MSPDNGESAAQNRKLVPDEEPRKLSESNSAPDNGHRSTPILGIIIGTAVLYFAKAVLFPLAMASVIAVALSPIAARLEKHVGRFLSAAMIVLSAVTILAGLAYFLSVELTSVAVDLTQYSDNIAAKLTRIEKSTPMWLQRVEKGVHEVEAEVEAANPKPKQRTATVQQLPSSTVGYLVDPAIKILSGIVDGLLTIVLVFFLLYSRHDLRDKIVRLTARAGIRISAEAIETGSYTVASYLLFFSIINLCYGASVGLMLWAIGLPNPELWGGLAFLLRYIPYVGATVSATMPTLVAFAVFPGWTATLLVIAAFVLLDQVAAQFVEPFLIGRGIGVSPVALLVSAVYWAWLWGPAGLILAIPLTAFLKVAGDYIPELGFFAVLLGADHSLEDYRDYSRRLLERDKRGAEALAIHYSDENGLDATFKNIFIPALRLAGVNTPLNQAAIADQQFLIDSTRELITLLGNRYNAPPTPPVLRVLGVCAPGELHSLGLLMLLEMLRQESILATFAGENKSPGEIRSIIERFAPDAVCLTATMRDCMPAAVNLVERLSTDFPNLAIVAGGRACVSASRELIRKGCYRVCADDTSGRRTLRILAADRQRKRSLALPEQSRIADSQT